MSQVLWEYTYPGGSSAQAIVDDQSGCVIRFKWLTPKEEPWVEAEPNMAANIVFPTKHWRRTLLGIFDD